MKLTFITGNQKKVEELSSIIPNIEQLKIDLPEIQELDPKEIIKAKLVEGLKHQQEHLIIEDTSLYLEGMNGFPGPLIKWLLQSIGTKGIAEISSKIKNKKAVAKTLIGYAKNKDEIYFFEGTIEGEIIDPQEDSSFGRDPIFQPKGYEKTFAQMSREEKNKISMRKCAANKLLAFLKQEYPDFYTT